MAHESPEVIAARRFANGAATLLANAPTFQQLDPATRTALVRDLGTIRQAFADEPAYAPRALASDPYALALETPADLARRRIQARQGTPTAGGPQANSQPAATNGGTPGPRSAATETLAARAGALSDEIDFPAFVANLVHGTFDAIVDASIRQMEAFAELVSAVAKDVDRFTSENVTANQARDWLVQQYPRDLALDFVGGQPRLRRRAQDNPDEDEAVAPTWLEDYGLADEELNDELIETQLVPAARRKYGENRLQMLATMVLMGMNRINVRDGSISARVRFRAAARDRAAVDYEVSQDPGPTSWGGRGSAATAASGMLVSTLGVNVQAESELKAELFGEVKINFVSETLPLERFVDAAQLTLLQRNARTPAPAVRTPEAQPPALPPPAPPVGPATGPATGG